VALHLLPRFVEIAEFEGTRLLKEFEHRLVTIHHDNGPQLGILALKLNGDAHFGVSVSKGENCTLRFGYAAPLAGILGLSLTFRDPKRDIIKEEWLCTSA